MFDTLYQAGLVITLAMLSVILFSYTRLHSDNGYSRSQITWMILDGTLPDFWYDALVRFSRTLLGMLLVVYMAKTFTGLSIVGVLACGCIFGAVQSQTLSAFCGKRCTLLRKCITFASWAITLLAFTVTLAVAAATG